MAAADDVFYLSYGSNLLSDRLNVYIEGGKLPTMLPTAKAYPGCTVRDPPRQSINVRLPHRVQFRLDSPTWRGGVCFLDHAAVVGDGGGAVVKDTEAAAATDTDDTTEADVPLTWAICRGWRVKKQQFEEIVLQENAWRGGAVPPHFSEAFEKCYDLSPGETLHIPVTWYNTILCVGEHDGCKMFTFSCSAADLARAECRNAPSAAYAAVIARGLVQMRALPSAADAARYLLAHTHCEEDGEREEMHRTYLEVAEEAFGGRK